MTLQQYLLSYDRMSVEQIARTFGTTCEEVTKIYHQMVVDGTVANYNATHRAEDGIGLINEDEFLCFEKFLKAYMDEHDLNRTGFAMLTGESPSSVSGWLYYKKHPRYSTVTRIADILNVDAKDMLNFSGARVGHI